MAKQLGREETRGGAGKAGLVFAGIAAVGAAITAVTLFFRGKF